MGYIFWKKLGITRGLEYERQLVRYVKLGYSQRAFERFAISRKLSYRRKDMLYDWHRAQAIEHAKTITAKAKAASWYDEVLTGIQKEYNVSYTKAVNIWKDIHKKGEKFEEFTPKEEDIWAIFNEAVYGIKSEL